MTRLLLLLFILPFLANGQAILKERSLQFLADLNSGDQTKIRSYFVPEAHIFHVDKDTMVDLNLEEFLTVCSDFASGNFREESYKVDVNDFENGFGYTNVYFKFFLRGELAFTGLDHISWVEREGSYLIHSVHSSRITIKPKITGSPGSDEPETQLNNLLNKWHKDAATAHLEDYFSFMDESFYFLGTDPTERWSKSDFRKFCQPYFEKKETWHFIPNWRNWYFSVDGQTAWFEESLDTWMEECRASGVVMNIDGEWKLVHYNLTVLIENDKIQKFIKLRRK